MSGDPQCDGCGAFLPHCYCSGLSDSPYLHVDMKPQEKTFGMSRLDPVSLRQYLTEYMGDEFFAEKFAECIDLIKAKNADYSQGEQKGDRIAAFRRIARDINITMEQAWAVFCQKHWGAVMKYVKQGTVESEPIDGRISDIINYMVLLSAIIEDGRKEDE